MTNWPELEPMPNNLVNYGVTENGIAIIELASNSDGAPLEGDEVGPNTYTHEMMRDIDTAVVKARFDDDVSVIVFIGHGHKFFSAGASIQMLNSVTPGFKYNFCLHANETLSRLEQTRKKKLVEGSNDDSGFSTALTLGYVTPLFGIKTTFGGTLEDTNLNGTYKDTKVYKTKLKIDYPIPPVSLGVQYDFSETENKVADPSLECVTICNGKTKNRNQVYTLSLNYPAAAWCIFGLTQKHESQSSNIVGKTYKVNSTQLQVILIY